ncbi:cytochrome P450 71A1-like [Asparagus officinalis]|uniref:cytochrome P450 71A1-like n=1 Tax=Asparagus officinalis TaxID=4686 RepID=UPI00098E2667|nr:cytochrome P450 71A1-like [Asparagus officinalis]
MTVSITAAVQLFLLLLLLLPLLFVHHKTKPKTKCRSPPGPPPLPVIGNLHQLSLLLHQSLYRLSKIHGPIFKLSLGRVPVLVISSPSLAKQVLKTHDLAFCSRASTVSFKEYTYDGCDVAGAPYGDSWRNIRKIFVLNLLSSKKLTSFRPVQEEEIEGMISSIRTRSDTNATVNITEFVVRLANNITFRVAFGYRSEGEYGEKSRFQRLLESGNDTVASFYVGDYFPGLGWLDKMTGKLGKMKRNARDLDEFYQEVIDAHMKDGRKEDGKEDIVDVLLRLREEGQLTMDHIKGALMNIFVGGTDTSSASIAWAMAELARKPNVMKKAQEEVRKAASKKGRVEENDLAQLQYIKCVVNETLRLHPPLPLLVPRETIQHCEINGYDVSAKTRVLVNAWAIGRDEDAWENPEEFNPDRFVGSSVDYRGQDFQFIPFGAGRRICPGIQFGVETVELALANLLYAFNWELPPGVERENIDMHEAPGLVTRRATDLRLVATNYEEAN